MPCSPEIQKGLRKSRATEWQEGKQFNAVVIISKAELQELLDAGVNVNPMKWIETDRGTPTREGMTKTSTQTSRAASSAAGILKTRMASAQTRRLEMLTRTTLFSLGALVIE